MPLSYKNNSKNVIINKLRDIRYANSEMLFGFNNNVRIVYEHQVDLVQLTLQADIFAREMLTHRSKFDMKRFLGQYQRDWLRILHEAYVYDFCKAIYYGYKCVDMLNIPDGLVSFPGNILLMNLLYKNTFVYYSNDSQPYSIEVKINNNKSVDEVLKPIFEKYPDVAEGISGNPRVVSYVNMTYEAVMKGFFNAKMFLDSKSKNNSLFEIKLMNDDTIAAMTNEESNPIMNSHLSEDGSKFYFINPESVSGPGKMRFNESLYISRAIGFKNNQIIIDDNNFYSVASRDRLYDIQTREDVYAISGLRSELIPYTEDQILAYCKINSYKGSNNNSDNDDDKQDEGE